MNSNQFDKLLFTEIRGRVDIMSDSELTCIETLVTVGLNKYEAQAYIALLKKNKATATEVAQRAGIPKQRIYDVLDNLQLKGLCGTHNGRPRNYIAFQPRQALQALHTYRKQQQAAENARHTKLINELVPSLNQMANGENGEIQSQGEDTSRADAFRDIGGL